MERVRHHVKAAGATTLRGFFRSDNVDYDPRSPSLRENVKKAKCQFVYSLADGATDADEENQITDAVAGSENSREVIRMVFALRGWEGMDDELEPDQLDRIALTIAQVLDQRDYPVYRFIRRHLPVLSYREDEPGPSLGDACLRILALPQEHQAAEIDLLLNQLVPMARAIAQSALRGRGHMVRSAIVTPPVIAAFDQRVPPVHREDDVVRFLHRMAYTLRIATGLEQRQYLDLYDVLLDMANGALDLRQRQAARDAVEALGGAFPAVDRAVGTYGPNEAKVTVARFMVTRQAALAAFDPAAPAATVLGAIAAAIGAVGATVADVRTAVLNLPDVLTEALTLSGFLDEDGDDKARDLATALAGLNALGSLPTRIKLDMIKACLDGVTDDDDEQAILKILRAAKTAEQAELWQLAASGTWEALDFSIDGEENDELVSLLAQPV